MTPDGNDTATLQAAEDIRDIRGLVQIPSPTALLPWLLLGAAVIAALVVLVRRRRARPETPIPPDALALAALDRARAWMTPEHAEKFATAVSTAIRLYIEARFELRTSRKTTEEFLRGAAQTPIAGLTDHVSGLEEILRRMDLVKFARAPLEEQEMDGLLAAALDFVRATRPQAESSS